MYKNNRIIMNLSSWCNNYFCLLKNHNCHFDLPAMRMTRTSFLREKILHKSGPQNIWSVFPSLIDRCWHIFNQKSIFKYLYHQRSTTKRTHIKKGMPPPLLPPNFKSIKSRGGVAIVLNSAKKISFPRDRPIFWGTIFPTCL